MSPGQFCTKILVMFFPSKPKPRVVAVLPIIAAGCNAMSSFSVILEDRHVKQPGTVSASSRGLSGSRQSWPVRLLIAGVVLGMPAWCGAQAYKGVDAEGRVIYSDQPLPNAEAIVLPSHSASADDAAPDAAPDAAREGAVLGPYEQFDLVAPVAGETLRSPAGTVQVSLLLSPALASEHQLEVLVNGAQVEGLDGRTQFALQGLSPGSHQVQARILDAEGAVVASTGLVSFNLLTTPAAADQP